MSEKLDEMKDTWRAACFGAGGNADVAIRAVLEAHVKPMIAEAFMTGACEDRAYTFMAARDYAARIIADLTKEPKP